MRFTKAVFLIAAIWGLLCLPPMYFLQGQIAAQSGPLTHLEYFYGFVGVAITWQLLFLLIWRDPARYRALMPVAVLEKLVFAVPVAFLVAAGKADASLLIFGGIDLALGALFVVAFLRTPKETRA